MRIDLYGNVELEGNELDEAIERLLKLKKNGVPTAPYSTDWSFGGPLIEQNQIFLDAPHQTHLNYGPGKDGHTRGEWVQEHRWTATVSASVRTKPNPNFEPDDRFNHLTFVGRGAGPTPLIACMRAIVDSFVHEPGCLCGACNG